jgi:flagellin-like hook-associated protein FlgL
MSNIVLGTATQQNLLALQNINSQLGTTQNHLATGLAVASATDDAVKYFQSQSLTQRANDLSTRKSAIDQGIQSLTAATNGISGVISVLQQMEGIVNGASTQTASQRASAATQFNTLGQQLTTLLNDSSYQGLNLVNSTASNLTLQFSIASTSTLKISGQNLVFSKLVTGGKALAKGSVAATKMISLKFSAVSNKISVFSNAYNALQTAVFKAQAAAQSLGTNVNFLQTRMSFTQAYMTTLQSGASDLTVADVNQESTNLVTLQTRQQLALQSLSIATSSEQAVLRLFH